MTAPDNPPYTISGRELVAETATLRVQVLTLGDGERVPWHYHSAVSDIFICLEGTTVVETRAPPARHQLKPGEHCVVPPGPHTKSPARTATAVDSPSCKVLASMTSSRSEGPAATVDLIAWLAPAVPATQPGRAAAARWGPRKRVGSTLRAPLRISKCNCGVATLPEEPMRAMTWPRLTVSPRRTKKSALWA